MFSTSRSRIGRCGRRGGQRTTGRKRRSSKPPPLLSQEEELTHHYYHKCWDAQLLSPLLLPSAGQNCLKILKNLPEQYQVHPLSQITHTKAKVDFISHWTDAFISGKTIWHFGAHQIVNSLVGYSSRKHMGLCIRFQPTQKRQQAIQVISFSKRHFKQS